MKVIIAAGGSGGHIFPSVALASSLKSYDVDEIYFVSSRRKLDRNILKDVGYPCYFLSVNPMPLRFDIIRIFTFLWKLFLDTFRAVCIIIRVKPSVVVGFGGYSSGAIVLTAKIFNIPVVIHEQNLVPGRANIILSRIADRIAVSFRGSREYFIKRKNKVFFSGNPLRLSLLANDRTASYLKLGLDPEKKTVLIMGGSQGSSFLNSEASDASRIVSERLSGKVQIIHLTGRNDVEKVREFYSVNGVESRVFSFLERIDEAYAVSDIAVSRAGAAAVFELAYYSIPMLLVPYPNPKNNQKYKAVYFEQMGAAVCLEEKLLTGDLLAEDMIRILEDKNINTRMSEEASKLSVPDAGLTLAKEIVDVATG